MNIANLTKDKYKLHCLFLTLENYLFILDLAYFNTYLKRIYKKILISIDFESYSAKFIF